MVIFRRIVALFAVAAITTLATAQSTPFHLYNWTYYGVTHQNEVIFDTDTDSSGSIYELIRDFNNILGQPRYAVIKFDQFGSQIYTQDIAPIESGSGQGARLDVTPSGICYVAFTTFSTGARVLVTKLNLNGSPAWVHDGGVKNLASIRDIEATDNEVVLLRQTDNFPVGLSQIRRIDVNTGGLLWSTDIPAIGLSTAIGSAAGSVYVSTIDGTGAPVPAAVLKAYKIPSGSLQFTKSYDLGGPTADHEGFTDLTYNTVSNSLYAIGSFNSTTPENSCLARLTSNGTLSWKRNANGHFSSTRFDSFGDAYQLVFSNGNYLYERIKDSGAVKFSRIVPGIETAPSADCVQLGSDGGFYFVSRNLVGTQFKMFRYTSSGALSWQLIDGPPNFGWNYSFYSIVGIAAPPSTAGSLLLATTHSEIGGTGATGNDLSTFFYGP